MTEACICHFHAQNMCMGVRGPSVLRHPFCLPDPERLLDTQAESDLLRSIVAPAVDHIHARIGTPQAPQVAAPSPGATTEPAAERFYSWWADVWAAREARSVSSRDATLTATVEYGFPAEWVGGARSALAKTQHSASSTVLSRRVGLWRQTRLALPPKQLHRRDEAVPRPAAEARLPPLRDALREFQTNHEAQTTPHSRTIAPQRPTLHDPPADPRSSLPPATCCPAPTRRSTRGGDPSRASDWTRRSTTPPARCAASSRPGTSERLIGSRPGERPPGPETGGAGQEEASCSQRSGEGAKL